MSVRRYVTLLENISRLKNLIHIHVIISLSIIFFFSSQNVLHADSSPIIKLIEIRGNKKINDDTIFSKMSSAVGNTFSKNTVQKDIKKLYAIGYFDDVRVEIESFEGGVKLIFIFIEKPTIVNLDFQGNEEYETKDLKEKITISPGAIANFTLISDNAGKVISYYHSEGYWLVKVIPVIREISEDAVALTYQIEEGPKVVIKTVEIEGNKSISYKKIKKVMKTRKWWLFSFITGSGTYEKEQIKEDLERIKALYHNNGFIYVAVSEPEITLSSDKEKLSIKISISEGDQYKVGQLKVEGNTVFSEDEIFEHVALESGQIFDRSALRKDIDSVIDIYMNRGYARADINPIVDVDSEQKTANLTFSIKEGGIYRIGRIDITGNTKTRDKVVRREMRLDEGDIFNKKLLKRSYQRINNLNYFESVDIAPLPRVEDKLVDLDIKVKEKLTGMLSLGGGYSSLDKFMVMGEVTQANLFGKGYHLKVRADFSSRRANYRVSLTDPWFLDKPISASISVYNDEIDFPDYDKKATGGSIGFGKELAEYVGGRITYTFEKVEIFDVDENASSLIRDQEGERTTSSISPSIWRDTRDNYLDTTTGSRNALYTTIAGLGGDNYFVKAVVDSGWYFPLYRNIVFSARGRGGYATGFEGEELPIYERFYIGGINTVRGLGFGEGGPRNEEGEKIGGEYEAIFNFELIFPLIEDIKLKGVTFFDYGGAFDDDHEISFDNMRRTAGAGVRWMSPFGPIRLEWGINLDPRDDEGDNKIEFSLGGVF